MTDQANAAADAGSGSEVAAADAGADVDLDTLISDAIAKSEGGDAGTNASEETVTDGKPVRDASGRFQSTKSPATTEPTGDGASKAAAASGAQQQEPATTSQPLEPHARWSDDEKAKFGALTPEAKQFALDIERRNEAAFTRKTQEFAEFKRSADPLVQAVHPFADYISQLGMQPGPAVGKLLQAEMTLRTGTADQKVGMLASLASQYGIDLAAMSRGQPPQANPIVTQLHQQVGQLADRLGMYEQQHALTEQQHAVSQIEAFANAKDEAGQPKYPHFERFRGVIGHLLASGEAASLEDAYTKATAPLRESVAAELSKVQQAADAARQVAVEKARKAAPVRSSGSAPGGVTAGQDLDTILQSAIAAAGIS